MLFEVHHFDVFVALPAYGVLAYMLTRNLRTARHVAYAPLSKHDTHLH